MIENIALNALKYFYYVANFSSVTEASKKLYVTQSAVSKQIKNLEQQLGFELFERINKRLILTSKGERLYETCQNIFTQLDHCLIELKEQENKSDKRLILSCEPTISMRWLIPRLAEFQRLDYGFDVVLLTAGGEIDLKKSGVDLALRRNDFAWDEHFYHEKMADEYMLMVKSSKYKKNNKLLLSSSRPHLWKQLGESGVFNTKKSKYKRVELEHFYLCIEACLAGLGATFASIYMVEKELNSDLLQAMNKPILDDSSYHLLSAEPFEFDERKMIFKKWLKNEMKKTRDNYKK